MAMCKIIMPPAHNYQRARSRKTFNRLFSPSEDGRLRQTPELPPDVDERHWWTVTDLDPNGQNFHLLPGFRFANRLGFIQTNHAWGGAAEDHPLYVY